MEEKWKELIRNRNLKTQNLKERELKIPFSLTDVKIETIEIKSNFQPAYDYSNVNLKYQKQLVNVYDDKLSNDLNKSMDDAKWSAWS